MSRPTSPVEYRHFPYANIDPPMKYADLMRRVPGGETPYALRRLSIEWVGMIVAVSVFGGLALYFPLTRFGQGLAGLRYFITIEGILGVLMAPVVAGAALIYAANAAVDEHHSGRFDLIRVSSMSPNAYIARKLALVRVQTWRVFMVMMGLRLGVAALACIALPLEFVRAGQWRYFDGGDLIVGLLGIYAAIWLGLLWLWVPLVEFRAATALAVSMAVSAREPSVLGTMLRAGWRYLLRVLIVVLAVLVGSVVGPFLFMPLLVLPFFVGAAHA